jgi:hypothetical protein
MDNVVTRAPVLLSLNAHVVREIHLCLIILANSRRPTTQFASPQKWDRFPFRLEKFAARRTKLASRADARAAMSLLPSDPPRLPKWPFFTGDAVFLGLACVIRYNARNPFAGLPLLAIVGCVALGVALAAVPFILDYARQQDEALDERQRGLESLAHTIASSAEQIGIAAQSLPGIAETAAKSLKLAEQLPARLQERLGEIKPPAAQAPSVPSEAASELLAKIAEENKRLQSTAILLRQAAADLGKLEAVAPKNLAAAGDELDAKTGRAIQQFEAKFAALAALAEKISSDAARSFAGHPPPASEKPESPPAKPPAIAPTDSEKSAEIETAAPENSVDDAKTARKRAPKKAKNENPEPALDFFAEAATTASPTVASAPSASGGDGEFSQPSPEDAAPVSAVSADGATRLLVTAYIGIGNKLFLRGDGPGLSWNEGVPLQFVSIGKWRWETADATAPVRAKLYKNDEIECAAVGELTLGPGQQAEVTAAF